MKQLTTLISLGFLALAFMPVMATAANSVKTQRIFVPEEKPDEEQKNDDEDTAPADNPSIIPDSALPSLTGEDTASEKQDVDDDDDAKAATTRKGPPPPVLRDFEALPAPVKRMRQLLLETARAGDIEKLRSLIGFGETATSLSVGQLDGDPIEHLKSTSGDEDGFEILAILIEVLEAGYVHVDQDTPEELYVWPYFFAWPLEKLTPQQRVELYQLLTAGDVQDSESFGSYIFYRVGITPDGEWAFFVAGD